MQRNTDNGERIVMIKQLWAGLSRARSWRVLVPATVVLAGGAGIAVAAIPSKINGVITSCYQLKKHARGAGGDLRVIDPQAGGKCKKGEKRLTFNQRGRAGADGNPGPQGAKGDTGPQGAQGPPAPLSASYRAKNDGRYFVDSLAAPNAAVTLDVPAPGTYHVTGKVEVQTPAGNESAWCALYVSGSTAVLDSSAQILAASDEGYVGELEGGGRGTLPISSIVTLGPGLGSPRTLRIDCASSDEEGFGGNATLEAVRVAAPG